MKKRAILTILFIIILSQLNIYSIVTNYGCLDEAKSLENKKFSIGGFNTTIFTPLMIHTNLYDNKIMIMNEYYIPMNLIPIIYLGINGRFGLKNDIEIGFTHLISSPANIYLFGSISLIGIYGDFTFKKSIKIQDNKYFAYRVNIGLNYIIPYSGSLDIILKNSFLFGFVYNKYSFNIVPSIKNSVSVFNGYFTVSPEILVNWHLYTTKKTNFIFELFLFNEFYFFGSDSWSRSISNRNSNYIDLFDSILCVGFSFGVSFTNK